MTINSAFDHNTAPDNLIDKKVKQIDSLIPSIEGKSGKVLAVKSDESGTEWKTVTSGTTDYTTLTNKPKINSVELTGSKSLSDIGAASETDLAAETTARGVADTALQAQIDAIESQSDVVDIVATHAALVAYDTTKLHDNDVIKVLADETQYSATSYNRWVITESVGAWTLIGTLGPFYTKSESDTLLAAKEAAANKVTSFQPTPDNTHYPSEKLVKDSLDAKQNVSERVSSFQVTPDNTHYPSEKLVKDSLDLKQDVSVMVTSFQETPDDVHYPSEKLVKDTLDGKANTDHSATHGYGGSDEITISESQVTNLVVDLAGKQKVITISTSEPTAEEGSDGDIWFVREA